MATNSPYGDNYRIGAVTNCIQVFNPRTRLWVKIDTTIRRIIDVKTSGSNFKGVRRYKQK